MKVLGVVLGFMVMASGCGGGDSGGSEADKAPDYVDQMVADGDSDDAVNGKFTLTKCCPKEGDTFSYEVCKE